PDSTVRVVLPELGESVTEGQIVGWRVSEGDVVEAGQTLVDVTTDKVDVEVPAPRAGRVTRLLAAEGDTVAVGAPLAELGRAAAGAQRRPGRRGTDGEALLHPPGGVGGRQGRAALAGDGHRVPTHGGRPRAARAHDGEPRPGRRRRAQGREPYAARARAGGG